MKKITISIYMCLLINCVFGQLISQDSELNISLPDIGDITLFESPTHKNGYYYLPRKLILAKENENSQYSFLIGKTKDQNEERYGVIHMMLTWGLKLENKKNLEMELQEIDSSVVVLGAINLSAKEPEWELLVKEDSVMTNILNAGVASASKIPTMSGSKWAIAFRFSGQKLKIIEELLTFPEKLHTVIVRFNYQYQAIVKEGSRSKSKTFDLKIETTFFELFENLN